jgi:hypothetical protein
MAIVPAVTPGLGAVTVIEFVSRKAQRSLALALMC